ncbi:uncharacterized protein BDW43DRAFT_301020 [Aspergillus alliaceus]|uniref:uncharacterized protein n=1 Tax=Petromyces alliaceus TaxID=209559 RepID=UPI0012A48367|nr:uncharacterized protein BDW43DRAFT_301020 [Aspergillus alliaceus]KAB8232420.1 hypothetical protein BDW43DRAFT_301020 [Aspergillus alliaceus]
MVIGLGCIWFTVGSVVASSAYSVALMSIARFIIGVGMGFETMVTPVYTSELSPSSRRAPPPSNIQALVQVIQDVNRSVSFDQGPRNALWSWKQLHLFPSHLRSLITACSLMALQQLSGFNSLMYYSATLFNIMGFSRPIEAGLIVSGTNFLFTALSLLFVDLGRRRLLVCTVWGLPVALAMAAGAFSKVNVDGNLELVTTPPFVGETFYAIALGNVPWLANELLALEVRAVSTAMLTMVCWGSNILVSATFLSLVSAISASGAFGLYAGVCFVGWVIITFTYPETAGLELESIPQVFEHGFGVRISVFSHDIYQ